jgi:hypothetical protein
MAVGGKTTAAASEFQIMRDVQAVHVRNVCGFLEGTPVWVRGRRMSRIIIDP